MKKILTIIAIITTMMISFSCKQEKVNTENVIVEEIDSTELCEVPAPDSLVVE